MQSEHSTVGLGRAPEIFEDFFGLIFSASGEF